MSRNLVRQNLPSTKNLKQRSKVSQHEFVKNENQMSARFYFYIFGSLLNHEDVRLNSTSHLIMIKNGKPTTRWELIFVSFKDTILCRDVKKVFCLTYRN